MPPLKCCVHDASHELLSHFLSLSNMNWPTFQTVITRAYVIESIFCKVLKISTEPGQQSGDGFRSIADQCPLYIV